MIKIELADTAIALIANSKGILAMDESNSTCNKRFASMGIPQTAEFRREYRELILTTTSLADCISGVILYDETIRQASKEGIPFVKLLTDTGILIGIKVDTGAKDMAVMPERKLPKAWTGCASAWQNTPKWEPVLLSGVQSSPWVMVCQAEPALKLTRSRWLALLFCARKLDSYRLSNLNF